MKRILRILHCVSWILFSGFAMLMAFSLSCVVTTMILAGNQDGARTEPEWVEVTNHRHDAETEVVLPDRSRVHMLNDTHACESDWAKDDKRAEGVPQSLWYALRTERQPGAPR